MDTWGRDLLEPACLFEWWPQRDRGLFSEQRPAIVHAGAENFAKLQLPKPVLSLGKRATEWDPLGCGADIQRSNRSCFRSWSIQCVEPAASLWFTFFWHSRSRARDKFELSDGSEWKSLSGNAGQCDRFWIVREDENS